MMLSAEILDTFDTLLARARASADPEPTAMTLASVDANGAVSARTVLLKAHDARGFVFYTNTLSRKGRQLAAHPRAALLFHWKHLDDGIQVRLEGSIAPVADAEADAYFASRPRDSQIGAWASEQSAPLPDRATFERRCAEVEARYAGQPVPRPPHWSGYRLTPVHVEFWYGVPFRLHERHVYDWVDGGWRRGLLYP
jgi:pyridoxamine 5'-phosphate oxidase